MAPRKPRPPKRGKLPTGTNPLAKRIGGILRVARLGRARKFYNGVFTRRMAAEQLGIAAGHYAYLEMGKLVPGPNLSRRLRDWLLCGWTFEGAPQLTERVWSIELSRQAWRTYDFLMGPATRRSLKREAKRLGMSGGALVLLAVERFLLTRPAFTTMDEAVKHLNKVRTIQALTEAPELRDILECEIQIAIDAGAELLPYEVDRALPVVEQITQIEPSQIWMGDDTNEEVDEL
jgi:hypothetical protein